MKNDDSAENEELEKELADAQNEITELKRRDDEVCLQIKNAVEEIEKLREELVVEMSVAEARRELERIRAEVTAYELQQSMAEVVQVKDEPQEEMSGRHDMVPRLPEPDSSEFYTVSILQR